MKYNSELNLYQKIKDLNQDEFRTFSLKNMLLITRFQSELLKERLNDNNENTQNFDKFFIYELNQNKDIQNTSLSRIVKNLTITDTLNVIYYLDEIKNHAQEDELKAIDIAKYHLSLEVMKCFSEEKYNIKKIDYHLFNESISNEIVEYLIDNVNNIKTINSSYDEQIITLNFVYANAITLNSETLNKIINKSNQVNDIIDIYIDKENVNYEKNIQNDYTMQNNQTLQVEKSANNLDIFVENLNKINDSQTQIPVNFHENLINILNKKINNINKVFQQDGHSNYDDLVHSKHFFIMLNKMHEPLNKRLDFLNNVKNEIEMKAQLKNAIENDYQNEKMPTSKSAFLIEEQNENENKKTNKSRVKI